MKSRNLDGRWRKSEKEWNYSVKEEKKSDFFLGDYWYPNAAYLDAIIRSLAHRQLGGLPLMSEFMLS